MIRTVFEAAKQQRLARSCAVLVGLFLTVYGHAPVLPVAGGCILAIGIAVLRAWHGTAARGSK
jgi:uncharacterized membrane protein